MNLKERLWKIQSFLVALFDSNSELYCGNCGWLPSKYNYLKDAKNPRYCPRCGHRMPNYHEDLPWSEPQITEDDYRMLIQEQINVADFKPCPKCGDHNKSNIGVYVSVLNDYIGDFHKHWITKIGCCKCHEYATTRWYRDFQKCIDEWNSQDI